MWCNLDNGKVKITGFFDNLRPDGKMLVSPQGNKVLKYYDKYVSYYTGYLDDKYQFNGKGKVDFYDGTSYMGNFLGGKRYGEGVFYDEDGRGTSGRWIGGEFTE